jgi:acyl carrier protein
MSDETMAKTAAEIERWLVEKIALRVQVEPERISVDEPITRLGIDSTEAVVLSGELQEWLGVKVPPTVAWDYPTIAALARFLEGQVVARG